MGRRAKRLLRTGLWIGLFWSAVLSSGALPARAQEDANLLVPSTVPLPDRSYDWNLPEQPNRPWLQMPHFEQSPILPDRIQFNAIPKANLLPENLRPRDLVEPALTLDSINEKQDIMPPHLLDEPLTPPHMPAAHEEHAETPYTGSMIFLSELPPPDEVPQVHPLFEGEEALPNHRQLLGW